MTTLKSNEIRLHKLIAQKDIHFSNSMIEAVNKRMKYNFLFRQELPDIEHSRRFLETAVNEYNNKPHTALYGFTPYEAFHGCAPDKAFFKPQIAQAQILRKAENRALSCDSCAFIVEIDEEN